ncbi:MAG: hypothetical protein IPO77_00320 [Acidobacteria bacterium]|nr:hypothetical protein [Acidobacteriota bacterium]
MMLTAAIIFFAFFSISPDVQAQTEPPKVEIGGHVSVLHLQGKQQIFEKTAVEAACEERSISTRDWPSKGKSIFILK